MNIQKILIKRLLKESLGQFDDIITFAAVVSSKIRELILRQGFTRTKQQRTEDRFINEYKNGNGTIITTQVYWGDNKLIVFFKLGSEKRQLMNSTDIERTNNSFNDFFNQIMSEFTSNQQYTVEFHIDNL